jgi:nucleoside-diphosphate-sugar epimerase
MTSRNVILIAGVLGVVGRSALRYFESLSDWAVVGLSRRTPDFTSTARFIEVDLTDAAACKEKLADVDAVTHILYCANYEKPRLVSGWLDPDHVVVNLAMLQNLMNGLGDKLRTLQHVVLMQGTKAYGAAAGPIKIPARENDPRYLAPNFYYAQEDYLKDTQREWNWHWTILRPQWVCGFAIGGSMNGMAALGTLAAISRELEQPLRFPGEPTRLVEATDAGLLAAAVHWAMASPDCRNEIFNIVNGDCFTWGNLWPRIAKLFEMECGPALPHRLDRVMSDKAEVWERIVRRHGLKSYRLSELVPNWGFADNLFGYRAPPEPLLLSGIKARKFGFGNCQDSEEMVLNWLRFMQEECVLPR